MKRPVLSTRMYGARLVITAPGREPVEVPLVAGAAVERLGLIGRLGAAVGYLLWGGSR